ncbi:MAG: hypothetical protein OES09_15720, partial [Gammaproteobacteria bacterium]|nr:hypothetical protein [Gammaproteobacteria bacterium]
MKQRIEITASPRRLARWVRSFVPLGALTALTLAGSALLAETVDDIEPLLQNGKIKTALERLDALLAEDPK